MSFGSNLRKERKKLGISQKVIARIVGVKPSVVSHWEKDEKRPSFENLMKLMVVYNCIFNELAEEEINEISKPVKEEMMKEFSGLIAGLESLKKVLKEAVEIK